MNRREFFKSLALSSAGMIVLPIIANAEERRRGGGAAKSADAASVMVDPNSAEAKALSYQPNHSLIKDEKLKIEKDGTKWNKQSCSNCTLFLGKSGDKNAPCGVFPGKNVPSTGWCTSWNLKKG